MKSLEIDVRDQASYSKVKPFLHYMNVQFTTYIYICKTLNFKSIESFLLYPMSLP
jgi:hypothetical protein